MNLAECEQGAHRLVPLPIAPATNPMPNYVCEKCGRVFVVEDA